MIKFIKIKGNTDNGDHVIRLDQIKNIVPKNDGCSIYLMDSTDILYSKASTAEAHAIILAAQEEHKLLKGRLRDLELENQDLRDRLSRASAPVSKFKSRLDGMREDAAALVENVPLDPDTISQHYEFYKAFDTIANLSKLDLSGMDRERLAGFIQAILDRVYMNDGDREMVSDNAVGGKYSSVVIGEAFIDLLKNDGSKDHVKVYFM